MVIVQHKAERHAGAAREAVWRLLPRPQQCVCSATACPRVMRCSNVHCKATATAVHVPALPALSSPHAAAPAACPAAAPWLLCRSKSRGSASKRGRRLQRRKGGARPSHRLGAPPVLHPWHTLLSAPLQHQLAPAHGGPLQLKGWLAVSQCNRLAVQWLAGQSGGQGLAGTRGKVRWELR